MDDTKKVSKYIFIAAFVILAYIAYLLVSPFLSAVIVGLLVAYILFPLHNFLRKLIKSNNISALLITLLILTIGVIGTIIVTNLLVNETIAVYEKVDVTKLASFVDKFLHSEKADTYILQFAEKGLSYFVSVASAILLKIPELVIWLFITLVVIFFSLKDAEKLKAKLVRLMPVDKKYKNKVIKKFSETMDAVVYSTIVISLAEAVIATIGFYIFGVSTPLLWGLVTFVLAMLPVLGPTTVWLPITIYQYFIGNKASAIGLAIYSLVIITILFEYILRPSLMAKKGRMHPIVALLGVIGGVIVFGIPGLILGPFLLSLFIFFAEIILGKEQLA